MYDSAIAENRLDTGCLVKSVPTRVLGLSASPNLLERQRRGFEERVDVEVLAVREQDELIGSVPSHSTVTILPLSGGRTEGAKRPT